MALAVCLLFDRRSERVVRGLWGRLEAQDIRTLASHTHGRHHPHLSYAVLRAWDVERVLAALPACRTAARHAVLPGTLTFPSGRVALAPAISAAIAGRQERVAGALTRTGAELHRNYVPGRWIPHVSVATRAQGASMATVVTTVADTLPLTLHVDRAALIDSSTGRLWPLATSRRCAAPSCRVRDRLDQVRDRVDDPGRPVGEGLDLVRPGRAGRDQHRAQARLQAADDVGVHPVPDHHGRLGVGVEAVERAAHHQRVRLADEVRLRPVAVLIRAATEPVAGSVPCTLGPLESGLVAMNRAPASISRIARVIASKE